MWLWLFSVVQKVFRGGDYAKGKEGSKRLARSRSWTRIHWFAHEERAHPATTNPIPASTGVRMQEFGDGALPFKLGSLGACSH
jgi:hypothetical protein